MIAAPIDSTAATVPAGGSSPADCIWCGASLQPDGERLAGRIRCPECGAATTDPWPTEAELSAAYGGWYRPADGRRFGFLGDAILGRTRGLLAARIDEIAPPGPILDVGAGDGTLLRALRERGREATGLERGSPDRSLLDIGIEDLDADGSWAAVVFWHSLEHLPNPGEAVQAASGLLMDGGVIAVAVPDTSSLQARAFGDRWLHLDIPRHLSHLTSDALRRGLAESGFEITRTSSTRGGQIVIGWLDGLVGMLPGHPSLYQALRRSQARSAPVSSGRRALCLLAAGLLLPLALLCSAAEIALHRSGTVYMEARRG